MKTHYTAFSSSVVGSNKYTLNTVLKKDIIVTIHGNIIGRPYIDVRLGCSFCNNGLITCIDCNIGKLCEQAGGQFKLNDVMLTESTDYSDDNVFESECDSERELYKWPIYFSTWNANDIKIIANIRNKVKGNKMFSYGPCDIPVISIDNSYNINTLHNLVSVLDNDFITDDPELQDVQRVDICAVCHAWLSQYESKFAQLNLMVSHPVLLLWDDLFHELIENNMVSFVAAGNDADWIINDKDKAYLDTVIKNKVTADNPVRSRRSNSIFKCFDSDDYVDIMSILKK
jgi:hypothetical protein